MNTKQILTGIQDASCSYQLSRHLDLIEQAIQRGECDYNALESTQIAQEVFDKINEFNERTYH